MDGERKKKPGRGGPRPKVRADDRRGSKSGGSFTPQAAFAVREGEREKVAEWAQYLTSRQIGLLLRGPNEPISPDPICEHFGAELLAGRANMVKLAGGKLLENVMSGKESSIHFVLRTLGDPGQYVERRELTGPNGGPIPIADLAALAVLNDEQLDALENAASILARIAGEPTDQSQAVPDPA